MDVQSIPFAVLLVFHPSGFLDGLIADDLGLDAVVHRLNVANILLIGSSSLRADDKSLVGGKQIVF